MAYNNLLPLHLVTSGDMSGSITSPAVYTQLQDNIGFQLNWTGSPTGTFSVQVSMDHQENKNNSTARTGNWVTLPLSPTISASGSADSAYIDINQISAPYIRVVYTFTSGTGVLNIYATAKGV